MTNEDCANVILECTDIIEKSINSKKPLAMDDKKLICRRLWEVANVLTHREAKNE